MFDGQMPAEELAAELEEYVYTQGSMPVLKHPLVFSVPYFSEMNHIFNRQLQAKKERLEQAERDQDWTMVLLLHERPYRIEAFLAIADRIETDREWWEAVRYLWEDTENLHEWGDGVIRTLLSRPHPEMLMTQEEQKFVDQLPDELTIYRGYVKQGRQSNLMGWSWTLDKNKAIWFANRFITSSETPHLATATVRKGQILGYLSGRNESEIVVDPELLDITKNEPAITAAIDSPGI